MSGDDAVRFCGKCEKNVYQLSNMDAGAIEELLAAKGGDLCARFYQRKDGTVLTADCAVGAKRVRRKRAVIGLGAGIASMLGVGLSSVAVQGDVQMVQGELPVQEVDVEAEPVPEPPTEVMGKIAPDPEEHVEMLGAVALEPEDAIRDELHVLDPEE